MSFEHHPRRPEGPLTMTVPEAGRRYFGSSRNGSYDAARRGEIPTIAGRPSAARPRSRDGAPA